MKKITITAFAWAAASALILAGLSQAADKEVFIEKTDEDKTPWVLSDDEEETSEQRIKKRRLRDPDYEEPEDPNKKVPPWLFPKGGKYDDYDSDDTHADDPHYDD